MNKEKDVLKNIRNNLSDSIHELSTLNMNFKRVPASSKHLGKRLDSIEQELEIISEKMLAYKLRRLADSKSIKDIAKRKKNILPEKEGFETNTFQCKSDLKRCLLNESIFSKALCYALFIRCVLKG